MNSYPVVFPSSESESEVGTDTTATDEEQLLQESSESELGSERPVESSSDEEEDPNIPLYQTKDEEFLKKYRNLKGKSLFVLFPYRLPVNIDTIKKRIKSKCGLEGFEVRRPRQSHTRFCMLDFKTTEERQRAMEILKPVEYHGMKVRVEIPKTDSDEFVQQLLQKRIAKREQRGIRHKLKKTVIRAETVKPGKNYTSSLLIRNIPSKTTTNELKEHFPDAIQFRLIFPHGNEETSSAIVTLPTPKDATKAKRTKITIGENPLKISFAPATNNPKNEKNKKTEEVIDVDDDNEPQTSQATDVKKSKKRAMDESTIDESQDTIKSKKNKKPKQFKNDDEKQETIAEDAESPTKKCKKSKEHKND